MCQPQHTDVVHQTLSSRYAPILSEASLVAQVHYKPRRQVVKSRAQNLPNHPRMPGPPASSNNHTSLALHVPFSISCLH